MNDQERKTYDTEAGRYEALVAHEDHPGNIPRAIDEILRADGLDVLDLGAGTGRLTLMLAPRAKSIWAFDASAHMLGVTRDKLKKTGSSNWRIAAADHRNLPLLDHCADLVVSGWSVSYLSVWSREDGWLELDAWLAEMNRVLRPAGTIILFESLGTGNESPIHLEHLETTYRWLEAVGFQSKWIRTDYRFGSVEEAVDLAGFFFGEEMRRRLREKRSPILPECTGVWWKTV